MQHIQPPGVFASTRFGFSQVVTSPPGTPVFVSGQVAWDENLGQALGAAGASPADVAFLRIYVAGYEASQAGGIGKAVATFFGDAPPPAQTLLGVQALAVPDLRIEIEALAVLPS